MLVFVIIIQNIEISTHLLMKTITCWASGATVNANIATEGPNATKVQPKNERTVIILIFLFAKMKRFEIP